MHDGKPFKRPIRPMSKKAKEQRKKQQQGLGVYDHPKPPPKKKVTPKKVTPKKKP